MRDDLDEALAACQPPPWTEQQLKARIGVIIASSTPEGDTDFHETYAIEAAGAKRPSEEALEMSTYTYETHEVERETEIKKTVPLMLDTGSNLHVFASKEVASAAHKHTSRPVQVAGVGALKHVFTDYISLAVYFREAEEQVTVHGPYSEKGRRDILSVSQLYNEHKIVCKFEPEMQMHIGNKIIPMYDINGLYFVDAHVGANEANLCLIDNGGNSDSTHDLVACVLYESSLTNDERARLLAVRLNLSKRTMQTTIKHVKGHGVTTLNASAVKLIQSDKILKRSRMRRKPVLRLRDGPTLKPQPGEHFIMDAHGPARAGSPIDGARYTIHAVCRKSNLSHDAKSTQLGEEVLIAFMLKFIAAEAQWKHKVLLITIDATPEVPDVLLGKLVREAAKVGVTVRRAPGGHHEGCAEAEQLNDAATRAAEAALCRRRVGRSWYTDARIYCCRNRNLTTVRGESMSRLQRHTTIVPRVDALPPFIFGTTMAYIQDEKLRDGKGNLDTRCPTGMLYGISGSSYLIYTSKGTSVKRGADVSAPLDEEVLLSRGLPDERNEDEEDSAVVARQLSEDAAARDDAADGQDAYDTGAEDEDLDTPEPLPAISNTGAEQDEGEAEPAKTSKRGGGQSKAKTYFPAPTKADEENPSAAGPPSKRLRARAALATAVNAVAILPIGDAEKAELVDTAVFQTLGGPMHDKFCNAVAYEPGGCFESYSTSVSTFIDDMPWSAIDPAPTAFECNKAARGFTEVETDLGRVQLDIPANARELKDSPFATQWQAADQKSVDVIHRAGCPYIQLDDARKQGYTIAPSVVQRKLKVVKATGRLADKDARKSRTAIDGAWLKRYRQRKGEQKPLEARNSHVEIADDTLIKMMLSEAAPKDEDISSADLPNAYNLAERRRPPIVLTLPDTCDKWDADGNELGLLLVVPHYGEEESGNDLDHMIKTELEKAGMQRAEGVPALHTMVVGAENGVAGGTVKVARIVDDFIITSPKGHPVLERIEAHFHAAFGTGVKFGRDAEEVAGFTWVRNRRLLLLTVRMTQHVVAAAKKYYPGLLEGKRPSKAEAKGMHLHDACDALHLPEVREGKLTRHQKLVQEITGALKFPEKIVIALTLPVHRLARIGSFPPPEGYLTALLVLEHAWDHRHDGITYGPGEKLSVAMRAHVTLDSPAPLELQGHADATWGLPTDVFGYVATRSGAAIAHGVKNIKVICESSYASEGVATQYLVHKLEYAQQIEQVFGNLSCRPTIVGTDSSSNLAVGSGRGAPSRSKHTLRRWTEVTKRMEMKQILLVKVDTEEMPADFLTKFVGKVKLAKSLKRATNSGKALPPK